MMQAASAKLSVLGLSTQTVDTQTEDEDGEGLIIRI